MVAATPVFQTADGGCALLGASAAAPFVLERRAWDYVLVRMASTAMRARRARHRALPPGRARLSARGIAVDLFGPRAWHHKASLQRRMRAHSMMTALAFPSPPPAAATWSPSALTGEPISGEHGDRGNCARTRPQLKDRTRPPATVTRLEPGNSRAACCAMSRPRMTASIRRACSNSPMARTQRPVVSPIGCRASRNPISCKP